MKKIEMKREAEALYKIVLDRYGDLLRPEELEEVWKGVETVTEFAVALRSVKLKNWDEPFFLFKPYKGEH